MSSISILTGFFCETDLQTRLTSSVRKSSVARAGCEIYLLTH